MAAVKSELKTSLTLQVEVGTTATGAAKTANRTYSNINPALSDDNALEVISAIGTLQSLPIADYIRTDKAVISQGA